MYTPAHYKMENWDLILEVMRTNSFVTLISQGSTSPLISHIPVLIDTASEKPKLLGHFARANPHWKELASGKPVTAIFNGPHSYISPAWYQPRADDVPTWNYVAVHVEGVAAMIEDPVAVYDILKKTTDKFESEYQTDWSLPENPNSELSSMLRAIIAFEIPLDKVHAKFKLSQKEMPVNRENTISELSKMGEQQVGVAEYMRRTSTPAPE